VFAALNSGDRLVRLNAFRNTVHVVHRDHLALVLRVTGPRLEKVAWTQPAVRELPRPQVEALVDALVASVQDEPLRMRDIKKAAPQLGDLARVALILAFSRGAVVRATASHARSNSTAYAPLDRWVGGFRPSDLSAEQALDELVRRYVGVFGPVTVDDVAWWVPCSKTEARRALGDLPRVELDGRTHFLAQGDLATATGLRPPAELEVRFLPYEDHFAKAYVHRSWFLDDELKPVLFPRLAKHAWPPECVPPPPTHKGVNQSGEIRPSIWVDGRIVGRWEMERQGRALRVIHAVLGEQPRAVAERIEAERLRLETFVNHRLVPISGRLR